MTTLTAALDPSASAAARAADLEAALARPDRVVALEQLLPDLLRVGNDALLEQLARGLAQDAGTPGGRRVLETVARSCAAARPAALAALRGAKAPAPAPVPVARTTARLAPAPAAPASPAPAATPTPLPALAPADDWAAPFEAALASPSHEALQAAALALLELGSQRPPAATPAATKALAGRFAVAALDHDGAAQQGLSRLARGLKALG
jgi:hypothetical protein